jgi:hypothetical protein
VDVMVTFACLTNASDGTYADDLTISIAAK